MKALRPKEILITNCVYRSRWFLVWSSHFGSLFVTVAATTAVVAATWRTVVGRDDILVSNLGSLGALLRISLVYNPPSLFSSTYQLLVRYRV
jgi:hypothetical protein